jgi:hypothetical protein
MARERAIEPDLPPSGRFIRQRVMVRGNPRGSKIVTFRVGARRDGRDYEPTRCRARRRGTDEQCGRFPAKGYHVCPIHGAGYGLRQRNGDKLAPEASGALGSLVRDRSCGKIDLASMPAFPDIAEFADRCRADPRRVDLEHDVILLSAFADALFEGKVKVPDAMTFVRVYSRIVGAKCKALRTKAAIDKSNAVPVDRVHRIIRGLVRLLVRYVPQELQPDVERELRLIEVSERDQPKPTRAKK